jgi:hypothetical protein
MEEKQERPADCIGELNLRVVLAGTDSSVDNVASLA